METITNDYKQRKLIIDAWGGFVEALMDRGWEGYLLTFKFKHIPGSEASRLRIMQKEVERVYATLLTRLFRRPHAKRNKFLLPRFVLAPDYPVAKHEKVLLREVTVNDGLHIHGPGLIHPQNRLESTLVEHFEDFRHVYIHGDHELLWIEITPIEYNVKYVVEYAFKTIRRRASFGTDGFIVLPRHKSELD